MGNYDELEGTLFEDIALFLSGGLHQEFKLDEFKSPNASPSLDELFELVKVALARKDMVGCLLEDVTFFRKMNN